MYKYIEDEKSTSLYDMNRELLLRKYAPHILHTRNSVELIIKYMYKLYYLMKYIKNYTIYDKNTYTDKEFIPPAVYECKKKPRVAVYTCIFGDYDRIKEPLYASTECDYFIITDQHVNPKSVWKKVDISKIKELSDINDFAMKNRWVKMHPFELFGEYEYTIYIDGCVRIVADMMPLVLSMRTGACIGIHEHPFRSNIFLEAKAVLKMNKCDNVEQLKKQLFMYNQEGFFKQVPLLEATVLVSNISSEKCRDIYLLWWKELNKHIHRDQISLPYVLWKLEIKRDDISLLGDNILLNPRFYVCKHSFVH